MKTSPAQKKKIHKLAARSGFGMLGVRLHIWEGLSETEMISNVKTRAFFVWHGDC